MAGLVTVILKLQIHQIRQTRLFDARAGIGQLFLTDRQPGDPQPPFLGRIFGKPAPATADLKHVIARFDPHLIHHRGIFGALRGLQAFLPRFKQGRGIGHAVIQPQRVKFIPQIVMIRDVF